MSDATPHSISLLQLDERLPELRATFCWSDTPYGPGLSVGLLRCAFDVGAKPAPRRILVSADSRYVLWLNGARIGRGPLKGTLEHYHAETYELAPLLRPGRNVLAAEVRWFGRDSPTSEVHGDQPGFFVQDLDATQLDTPGTWHVWRDDSISPGLDDPFTDARGFLGPLDRIDAARRPRDWNQPGFDDAGWSQAIALGPSPRSIGWGIQPPRRLASRDIPALPEEPRPFQTFWHRRAPIALPWSLGADEGGEIWLDAGALTTSYPMLEFIGGAGREVRLVYAEALGQWEDRNGSRRWRKVGVRDDITRLEPHGYRDVLLLAGGEYLFEPFHWRTFWFLKIEILPGAEPVTLVAASHRFTTYPQSFSASFTCAEPDVAKLWEVSLRTLQLCAHETYEDCPYFEQLNYIGDTRLQALCSYHLANDTRLARRCLRLFRDTLGPEGLLASRAPSRSRQIIPAFGLHWILMLGDYWQWRGVDDVAFVRSCLNAVDSVLGYFRGRVGTNGFVGRIDDWAWTDWVPGWNRGVAPVAAAGTGSTYFTALFIHALDTAARLHREAGTAEDAPRWEKLARDLRSTLHLQAWNETSGLFSEGPGREHDQPTQHAQVMAVLARAADEHQRRRVLERLLDDPSLVPVSLFQRFHLARALELAGGYERLFSTVLSPWRAMLRNGLTTWQEESDPTRSDCHAWSSWMVIDFFATVLGARPAAPGWKAIRIAPQFFVTTAAAGEFATPTGRIAVRWSRDENDAVHFSATVPIGIPTTVILPGAAPHLFESGGAIELTTAPLTSAPPSA